MHQTDDPEKATESESPRLDHSSTVSTIAEALDAEANFQPPEVTGIPDTAKNLGPAPPPNGGYYAWLQVAGSFFLFFNSWLVLIFYLYIPSKDGVTQLLEKLSPAAEPSLSALDLTATDDVLTVYYRGLVNAFGVFQTYYESNPLWHETPSSISWIGSIQAFLLMLVGVLTGPIFDRGHFRLLITIGAVMIPFGLMMTSLCQSYWQTVLAQAFCIGLGNGFLFIPSVAILPQYFSTKKALANGIAASGSSFGGVIYPIVFRQLYPKIGFAWSCRVLGFISLVTVWFSVAVMRPRVQPKEKRRLTELKAFKEPPYTLFCFAMVFGFLGFYGPCYYIQPYAIQKGITSENLGFYLLPMLNTASIIGRILPNFITDYTGPLNVLTPASLITAILALCWIGIETKAGVITFAVLYGLFSGGFVSLPPVALVTLTPDLRTLGTRMGQSFALASIALLIGSPIAGAILRNTGSYLGLQLFSGLALLVCGVLLFAARVMKVGWALRVRA